MNAVNQALYGTLSTATAITSLLAGTASVYHIQAPDNATLDYVVFSHQSGGGDPLMPGQAIEKNMWIRAYSKTSAAKAGSIHTQIAALLDGKTLSVTGYTNFWTKMEQEFEFVENLPNGSKIWTCGAEYKIKLD